MGAGLYLTRGPELSVAWGLGCRKRIWGASGSSWAALTQTNTQEGPKKASGPPASWRLLTTQRHFCFIGSVLPLGAPPHLVGPGLSPPWRQSAAQRQEDGSPALEGPGPVGQVPAAAQVQGEVLDAQGLGQAGAGRGLRRPPAPLPHPPRLHPSPPPPAPLPLRHSLGSAGWGAALGMVLASPGTGSAVRTPDSSPAALPTER